MCACPMLQCPSYCSCTPDVQAVTLLCQLLSGTVAPHPLKFPGYSPKAWPKWAVKERKEPSPQDVERVGFEYPGKNICLSWCQEMESVKEFSLGKIRACEEFNVQAVYKDKHGLSMLLSSFLLQRWNFFYMFEKACLGKLDARTLFTPFWQRELLQFFLSRVHPLDLCGVGCFFWWETQGHPETWSRW